MPRIRTVKPAYPKHRKVRSVSRDCRLLNIHLWTLADDEGRLQELPAWIIGEVFPEDEDVTPVVLREWLGQLEEARLIVRYEADGERYIQCHDFNDHQVINKAKPSEIPPPSADSAPPSSAPVDVPDSSAPEVEEEGEKEGETTTPAHLRPVIEQLDHTAFSRSTTSPKPSVIADVCEAYPDRDLEAEAEKFRHYWTDGPGSKRALSDVAWSWRSWLERAKPAGGRSTVTADLERLEKEHAAAVAEEAANA